jgi:uncharacterized membrane protein YhaH (DUF805 family)
MNEAQLEHEYPGVGRLHYFLGNVGMIAAVVFVLVAFGPESTAMSVMTLVVMVASLILDVMRLRNIGVSQWFVFLRYLPFGNMLLGFGLQNAQTGWVETRRLDSAGKSILIAQLILLALILFVHFRTGISVMIWY